MQPQNDEDRRRVERMRSDISRLADSIEAILVLAEGATHTRSTAIVNLADLARERAGDVSVEAPEEALIEGDEHLLSMALHNMLENAERYAGGARLLRLSREGEAIRLSVVDHGPGLGEGEEARVFERYFRGVRDGRGVGLGLAFVRAVAERHGGRAEARPGPGGEGLEVSMLVGPATGWHEGR
jgi:signal transduction histidine kinase